MADELSILQQDKARLESVMARNTASLEKLNQWLETNNPSRNTNLSLANALSAETTSERDSLMAILEPKDELKKQFDSHPSSCSFC